LQEAWAGGHETASSSPPSSRAAPGSPPRASGARSYTQTMKWIVASACVLVVMTIGLLFFRNTPRTFNEADAGCTIAAAPSSSRGEGASLCFPAMDAVPSDYFQTARDTCAEQRVDNLARQLETRPKAAAVARAYSRWMRSEAPGRAPDKLDLAAVYTGCLKGLRED
jgi:hypothetical protein